MPGICTQHQACQAGLDPSSQTPPSVPGGTAQGAAGPGNQDFSQTKKEPASRWHPGMKTGRHFSCDRPIPPLDSRGRVNPMEPRLVVACPAVGRGRRASSHRWQRRVRLAVPGSGISAAKLALDKRHRNGREVRISLGTGGVRQRHGMDALWARSTHAVPLHQSGQGPPRKTRLAWVGVLQACSSRIFNLRREGPVAHLQELSPLRRRVTIQIRRPVHSLFSLLTISCLAAGTYKYLPS